MNSESTIATMATVSTPGGRTKMLKAKKFSDNMSHTSPSNRKSLQLLQPLAGNQTKLVGSDGFVRLAQQTNRTPKRKLASDGKCQPPKISKQDHGGKNFTIFVDKSQTSSSKQKSAEEEAHDMMTKETMTEAYWQELAEERRVALEETLKENEELHVEIADLKEENERLQVMADQAEYLADVVQTLLGQKDDEDDDKDEDGETVEARDKVDDDTTTTQSDDGEEGTNEETSGDSCQGDTAAGGLETASQKGEKTDGESERLS